MNRTEKKLLKACLTGLSGYAGYSGPRQRNAAHKLAAKGLVTIHPQSSSGSYRGTIIKRHENVQA